MKPVVRVLWCLVLILLLMTHTSIADKPVYETPPPGMISENEAVRIACEFLTATTGIDPTHYYDPSSVWVHYFCEEFDSPTESRNWVIPADTPHWSVYFRGKRLKPVVNIHAKSGSILFWRMRSIDGEFGGICAWPQEGEMTASDAFEKAKQWVDANYDAEAMNTPFLGRDIIYTAGQSAPQKHYWEITIDYRFNDPRPSKSDGSSGYHCNSCIVIDPLSGDIISAEMVLYFDSYEDKTFYEISKLTYCSE